MAAECLSPPEGPLSLDEPTGPGFEQHIPELDGIRGLAVLAVVFYHIALYAREHSTGLFLHLLDVCLFGGFGVDVFFALSGFLITRILVKRRKQPHFYRNFYARRFLRLAPPYALILILIAIFIPGSKRFLLLSLAYFSNFFAVVHVQPSYGPLWSLSVEEHFYLLWPAVIRTASIAAVSWILVVLCIASPLLRLYEAYHGGFNAFLSWYRMDAIGWGAVIALLLTFKNHNERAFRWGSRGLAIAGALIGLAALWWFGNGEKQQAFALFYSSVPMMTAFIIGKCVDRRGRGLAMLRNGVLRFMGDISYWLYLIHLLILVETARILSRFVPALVQRGGYALWLTVVAIVLSASILSGIAVREWIELPALRNKSRYR